MNNINWKLTGIYSALVVSSGNIFLGDKHPKGLYLDNVLEMIRANPDRQYYSKQSKRKITLSEAVAFGQLDQLGQEQVTQTSLDLILMEQDREFEELPGTGRELLNKKYKSKPRRLK